MHNRLSSFPPLVSIIVCIFNTERYISRCISSLLIQSYSNIEVLLIDDASTDKSGEICFNLSVRDKRIRFFSNKQNCGAGPSANLGIKQATGKYIMFCDSDDFYQRKMVATMVAKIEQDKSDLAICLARLVHTPGAAWRLPMPRHLVSFSSTKDILEGDDIKKYLIGFDKEVLHPIPAWNKIYRSSFLRASKCQFFNIKNSYPDISFYYQVINSAKRISLIRRKLYCYCWARVGAATYKINIKELIVVFDFAMKKIFNKYNEARQQSLRMDQLKGLYRYILLEYNYNLTFSQYYLICRYVRRYPYVNNRLSNRVSCFYEFINNNEYTQYQVAYMNKPMLFQLDRFLWYSARVTDLYYSWSNR